MVLPSETYKSTRCFNAKQDCKAKNGYGMCVALDTTYPASVSCPFYMTQKDFEEENHKLKERRKCLKR